MIATMEAERKATGGAVPEVGIYPNTPAVTYHGWDAASNSRLKKLNRSPRHLKEYLDNPPEQTPSMLRGDGLHTLVLEPHLFKDIFTMGGQCEAKTGGGSRCTNPGKVRRHGHWFCGVKSHDPEPGVPGDDLTILAPALWEKIHRMRDSAMAHPAVRELLEMPGERELSYVWDDPETGLRCKARSDIYGRPERLITDLKTTADASEREFPRSIFNFGYHQQGAHYIDGAEEVEMPAEHFIIVAIEDAAPYEVVPYRLREDAIEKGREKLRELRRIYKQCMESGEWPGYSDIIVDVSLPDWAWKKL